MSSRSGFKRIIVFDVFHWVIIVSGAIKHKLTFLYGIISRVSKIIKTYLRYIYYIYFSKIRLIEKNIIHCNWAQLELPV